MVLFALLVIFADSNSILSVDSAACSTLSVAGEELLEYVIFPNPSNSILNVDTLKEVDYRLVSLSGQEIFKGQINADNHTINISDLSRGIYLIQLTDNLGNTTVKKIVKQ